MSIVFFLFDPGFLMMLLVAKKTAVKYMGHLYIYLTEQKKKKDKNKIIIQNTQNDTYKSISVT